MFMKISGATLHGAVSVVLIVSIDEVYTYVEVYFLQSNGIFSYCLLYVDVYTGLQLVFM